MNALTLPSYQGNIIRALKSLELRSIPIPGLQPDEVLVRIQAAPVNPSDLAFIQGGYNVRKALPAIPGFEGTGEVIKTGNDPAAKALKGRRVSFFSQTSSGGSWATHIRIKATECLELVENLPVEQAACFSVNPFTAYAMVELARETGSRAIVQNAAAGQVGRFINILAERENIRVINIVRKEEHVEKMESLGFTNVLWALDNMFRDKLKQLSATHGDDIVFDAVGGELTGHILDAMPDGTSLYLYGALGARTLSEIPASDIIFKQKSVRGFNMNEWKKRLHRDAFRDISNKLQLMFAEGVLETGIQGTYPLRDYEQALMQYIRTMSEGKVLLIPE